MNFIKPLVVFCALALLAGQAPAKTAQKTEAPDIQVARKKLADLELRLKASRAESAKLKARLEQNDHKLQEATASARSLPVKNYGRRTMAKNRLSIIRSALQLYYCDTYGEYPAALESLVPAYLEEIPALDIPGYAKTRKAVTANKAQGDDVSGFVTDSGGWLYVADKTSKYYGKVFIDARAKDKGTPFFKY
jgi:hypothetical protein